MCTPAGDVEAGGGYGLVRPALEVASVVDHLKERVGPVHDGPGQVEAIAHVGDGAKCVDQRPVGAAHGATVAASARKSYE